jgi:hypothetical protein
MVGSMLALKKLHGLRSCRLRCFLNGPKEDSHSFPLGKSGRDVIWRPDRATPTLELLEISRWVTLDDERFHPGRVKLVLAACQNGLACARAVASFSHGAKALLSVP